MTATNVKAKGLLHMEVRQRRLYRLEVAASQKPSTNFYAKPPAHAKYSFAWLNCLGQKKIYLNCVHIIQGFRILFSLQ